MSIKHVNSKQAVHSRQAGHSHPLTDGQSYMQRHIILVLFVDNQMKRYEQTYKNKDNVVSTPHKKFAHNSFCDFNVIKKRRRKGRGKKRRQQCHTMSFLLATCSMCTPHFFLHGKLYKKHCRVLMSRARYFRHCLLHQSPQRAHLDINTITRDSCVL